MTTLHAPTTDHSSSLRWLVPTIVVGVIMILAGAQKLADNARLYEPFVEFGWPRWTYFATGFAEVGGGLALLWRGTRPIGGLVIAAVMTGAILTNAVNGDVRFIPLNLVLGATASAAAWHWSGRSFARSGAIAWPGNGRR